MHNIQSAAVSRTFLNISLRKISRSNYEAVADLDVSKDQQDYVACNMWSLVESHYNEGYTCRAIYRGEEPVGFFMWVKEKADKVSIWRFMVDQRYQGAGIGRAAMDLALDEIKCDSSISKIEICYMPENPVAKNFYRSFGFEEIGLDENGEEMLAVLQTTK